MSEIYAKKHSLRMQTYLLIVSEFRVYIKQRKPNKRLAYACCNRLESCQPSDITFNRLERGAPRMHSRFAAPPEIERATHAYLLPSVLLVKFSSVRVELWHQNQKNINFFDIQIVLIAMISCIVIELVKNRFRLNQQCQYAFLHVWSADVFY
jgi:hypothetical protein